MIFGADSSGTSSGTISKDSSGPELALLLGTISRFYDFLLQPCGGSSLLNFSIGFTLLRTKKLQQEPNSEDPSLTRDKHNNVYFHPSHLQLWCGGDVGHT